MGEPGTCDDGDATPLSYQHRMCVHIERGVASTQCLPSRDNIYQAVPGFCPFPPSHISTCKCRGDQGMRLAEQCTHVPLPVASWLESAWVTALASAVSNASVPILFLLYAVNALFCFSLPNNATISSCTCDLSILTGDSSLRSRSVLPGQ